VVTDDDLQGLPGGNATGKAPAPLSWQQKVAVPRLQARENAKAEKVTPGLRLRANKLKTVELESLKMEDGATEIMSAPAVQPACRARLTS